MMANNKVVAHVQRNRKTKAIYLEVTDGYHGDTNSVSLVEENDGPLYLTFPDREELMRALNRAAHDRTEKMFAQLETVIAFLEKEKDPAKQAEMVAKLRTAIGGKNGR
jgi:hypothetical protein